jgi:amino acid transporter
MLSFGKRPRELRWYHAGPMLFGDWGTSRLYVLGLAFLAAGHGSFFYVSWMCALLLVVAWAYTVICRAYPDGGGVYAAGRDRHPLIGIVGALLLFADYVVTAALSALDAFHYLGVPEESCWALAIVAIIVLGLLHSFGPKKAGVLALWIAIAAIGVYLVLGVASLPHLKDAQIVVPTDTFGGHWRKFTLIVLALSGVEAVANMTGIMVQPLKRTVRLTIWPVAAEVVVLNLVFALAINAIPVPADRLAEFQEEHKGDMLRVLADAFVGPTFAAISSFLFALLLLSAASTALTGMLGVGYATARDGELPRRLGRISRFGVPLWSLALAVVAPCIVLVLVRDVEGLAALYAIGVVGAIALNCAATATSKTSTLGRVERGGLTVVAIVMLAIWVTTAVEKPHASLFAGIVLGTGLAARTAMRFYRRKVRPVEKVPFPADAPRILVASRGDTWIVDQGLDRANEIGAAMVLCLIREASFIGGESAVEAPDPGLDPEADALFEYARRRAQDRNIPMRAIYSVSTSPMSVVADHAITLGVAEVHVGGSRRTKIEKVLRGSPLDELRSFLPEETTKMVVHSPPADDSPAGDD